MSNIPNLWLHPRTGLKAKSNQFSGYQRTNICRML